MPPEKEHEFEVLEWVLPLGYSFILIEASQLRRDER